jgi:hypothetical protein
MKFINSACVIVGIVMGFGTRVFGVDPLTRLNLVYNPTDGSLLLETEETIALLHISTDIDFFTGPEPPEYDDLFHVFKPRNIGTSLVARFGSLSFPPGTVAQGLSPAEVAEGMIVEAYGGVRRFKFDAWCFSGVSCFWEPSAGDFNNDYILDQTDIHALTDAVHGFLGPLPNESRGFDLDFDGALTPADRQVWVNRVKRTYFGDSNLDGEFNPADLIAVFQAGEYLDNKAGNSTWATGDWNGDGDFTHSDFVTAFVDGGYGRGPRVAAAPVPEPASIRFLLAAMLALVVTRKKSPTNRRLVQVGWARADHVKTQYRSCFVSHCLASGWVARP